MEAGQAHVVDASLRPGQPDTSEYFQRLLADQGVTCSMSRRGECWDNAEMESFFSTLKIERVFRSRYKTRDEGRADSHLSPKSERWIKRVGPLRLSLKTTAFQIELFNIICPKPTSAPSNSMPDSGHSKGLQRLQCWGDSLLGKGAGTVYGYQVTQISFLNPTSISQKDSGRQLPVSFFSFWTNSMKS